jgi:hypothetical protein
MAETKQENPRYEAPRLVELGTVHELTQTCAKVYGDTDGFTMNGLGLATASCTK